MIGEFMTKKSKILATALVAFSVSTSGAYADCYAFMDEFETTSL